MGSVVVTEFVTLDGVMEDPGGAEDFEHGGWSFKFDRGDDGAGFKLDEVMRADAHLLGRVTYEGFAAAWPSRSGEFADKINGMRKYVVSTTMDTAEWDNSTVIKGDLAEEVRSSSGSSMATSWSPAAPPWSRRWSSATWSTSTG